MRRSLSFALCLLMTSALAPGAFAQTAEPVIEGLPSLEQLVNVEVTSVSRKEESAHEASAAVYVITAEDIRRSGATSIPEALRMAPGLHVARSGSSGWAITSRGFNSEFSNKMLVLMDGRSVYTPLFGGVYWDEQQQLLDNIERIEVIRGPAGSVWGANAVNGVINIITKDSAKTQGGYSEVRIGNDQGGGGFRYGGEIGSGTYRTYAIHERNPESFSAGGSGLRDDWKISQGGFRTDLAPTERDKLTVQGDYYEGDENHLRIIPTTTFPFSQQLDSNSSHQGGNINLHWDHKYDDDSVLSVQSYYDMVRRTRDIVGTHEVQMFDTEVRYHQTFAERHDVVLGAGYRLIADDLQGSDLVFYNDTSENKNLFSAFIRDEIALYDKELFLTLGSKFEHNDYTGFEYQPNARLSWLLDEDTTAWAAVSRAIRSPYRAVEDVNLAVAGGAGPSMVTFLGQPGTDSEELLAYEVGYRTRFSRELAFDATAFYNDYDHMLLNQIGAPFTNTLESFGTYTLIPLYPETVSEGQSYGGEIAAFWDVYPEWRLRASYSFVKTAIDDTVTTLSNREDSVPTNQFNIRSMWDITVRHELDAAVYYYDNVADADIDSYVRTDLRFAWKPRETIELSIVGQNLLDEQHPEFSPFTYTSPAEIGRTVYGKIAWRF